MTTTPKRLLTDEPMSRVLLRVSFQLIRLDARKQPDTYKKHPPSAMLDLAIRLRSQGWHAFYRLVVSAAKCHQMGYSLVTWRDGLDWPQRDRALHKQRPRRRA